MGDDARQATGARNRADRAREFGDRARAWILGAGLLRAHAGLFLLAAVALLLTNLLRSPNQLWFWGPVRAWGAFLGAHAAAVATRAALRDLAGDRAERSPVSGQSGTSPAGMHRPTLFGSSLARTGERTGAALVRLAGWGSTRLAHVANATRRWVAGRERGDLAGERREQDVDPTYATWGRPAANVGRNRRAVFTGLRDRAVELVATVSAARPSPDGRSASSDGRAGAAAGDGARPPAHPAVAWPTPSGATAPAPAAWASRFGAAPDGQGPPRSDAGAASADGAKPGALPSSERERTQVPSLFYLRRQGASTEPPAAATPGRTTPVAASGGEPVLPEEDVVLAGPSPLDAPKHDLDWTWMEAAAEAWLASREAGAPPDATPSGSPASPATEGSGAPVAPPPAEPATDQRAGAG